MIGAAKIVAALMLGLALTGGMGAGIVTHDSASTPPVSQEIVTEPDPGIVTPVSTDDLGMTEAGEPMLFPTGEVIQYPGAPDGSGPVAIGLAARWGYLNDPTVAQLEGRWRLVNESCGGFKGVWHVFGTRANGFLWGGYNVAPDGGHGRFAGKWNYSDGRDGGFLAGGWDRFDGKPGGGFAGFWNFTSGRPGGVLNGLWRAAERGEGVFGGLAIQAPAMDMVPWDGFVKVEDGKVGLIREVRFEHGGEYRFGGDDMVYPQRERDALAWRSSTTTNWDGLIVGMLVPRGDVKIAFHTEQWSKVFTARELVGLHIRVPIDRMGHEIELMGFLIRPPEFRCPDGTVKVSLGLRWGYLGETPPPELEITEPQFQTEIGSPEPNELGFTPWNGFVQVTRGGIGPHGVLNWERGGDYRNGRDDFVYPRDNRLTIEWRSSITGDWDGIVMKMCLPIRGGLTPHVTIHTDQWTHVYSLDELRGLNERYPVGNDGQEIQVVARIA